MHPVIEALIDYLINATGRTLVRFADYLAATLVGASLLLILQGHTGAGLGLGAYSLALRAVSKRAVAAEAPPALG